MGQKPNENKEKHPKAKVTTYLYGVVKKNFFTEIKQKGITEAELAREIIIKHYI